MVSCYLQATWTWEYRTPQKEGCLTPFFKAGPSASIHACLTVRQKGKWCNEVLHFSKTHCTCAHALMCAFRTDGKIRPFDVSPDGRGQLVATGTELRPPESWGPNPGAASLPPPLSLSSPRSSDQYTLLITANSMVFLSSHLCFHFSFAWFSNHCHCSATGSSY